MSASQLHLIAVHFPVAGTLIALFLLLFGLLRRESVLERAACWILMVCAVVAAAAYFSGPPAWERIEAEMAHAQEMFERHGVLGKASFVAAILLGILAFQVIAQHVQGVKPVRWLRLLVLVLALLQTYLMAWTAHLGGLIRHPELSRPELFLFPWTGSG